MISLLKLDEELDIENGSAFIFPQWLIKDFIK
jgi:hypothetical protein